MLTKKGKEIESLMDKLANRFRITEDYLSCLNFYTSKGVKIILKYAKKHYSILDAGGGFGRLSIPLAKLGYSVTLLDVSEALIRKAYKLAKKEGVDERIKFVHGDILNLRDFVNKFDMVICMRDVLNYCCDHFEEALDNLCLAIRKNGYLILSVGTKLHYILSQGFSSTSLKALIKGYVYMKE
jgi:2-polyprenyl-3-methyl-5-hydroxy-6-metoxy-1,4-benzoquinol methylase